MNDLEETRSLKRPGLAAAEDVQWLELWQRCNLSPGPPSPFFLGCGKWERTFWQRETLNQTK